MIWSLLFIVGSPTIINAQQHFDREAPPLQDLLQEALENNLGLESSRYHEEATEQRIEQVQAWMPPVLKYQYNPMATGSFDASTGSFDGVAYTNTNFISFSQTIPFPGKIRSQVDIEEARYRKVSEERAFEELELAANVKETYYELWFTQKKTEVNAELQSLLEDFIHSATRMYEVDRIGFETVLSAETELAKLRTEERTLVNEYNKGLVRFNQLLDRKPDTPLGEISKLPPESIPADAADLEQQMLNQRPDLQAMRHAIEMNKAEIRSARTDYFPDIMVDLMYMDMPGMMTDRFGAGVSIQIPLAPWSSNKVTHRVTEVRRQRQSSEKSLEDMTTTAQANIRQAMLDLETQLDVIRLYREEVIPKAEQTAESALAAFESGEAGYLVVLDSFRSLEAFRREFYTAQADFHKSVAELERQAGIVM